jgi:hypothetical protein
MQRTLLFIVALLAGCSQLPMITTAPATALNINVEEILRQSTNAGSTSAPVNERETSSTLAKVVSTPTLINKVAKQLNIAPKSVGATVEQTADLVSSQLKSATMTFEAPTTANVNDTVHAVLRIDPNIVAISTTTHSSTRAVIQVSKILNVTLLAPDFKVLALTPDRQALSETEITEWKWDLSGAPPGKHDIHLSINAIVTVDNDRAERSIKTFESTITVEIAPQQRLLAMLKEHMQWIWSTLLLPAGMWLWQLFKKGDVK